MSIHPILQNILFPSLSISFPSSSCQNGNTRVYYTKKSSDINKKKKSTTTTTTCPAYTFTSTSTSSSSYSSLVLSFFSSFRNEKMQPNLIIILRELKQSQLKSRSTFQLPSFLSNSSDTQPNQTLPQTKG
jgi:hypothetical protein